MASPQLPNYLKAHRKRLALTQKDVAYLLGVSNPEKVSRHETFIRDPRFESLLAYEVIFQRPVREIFAGLYAQIEQEVAMRAKELASKMDCRKPNQRTTHRLRVLAALADPQLKISRKSI
jgi:transcriptional regulator with XRE-family HTH domain